MATDALIQVGIMILLKLLPAHLKRGGGEMPMSWPTRLSMSKNLYLYNRKENTMVRNYSIQLAMLNLLYKNNELTSLEYTKIKNRLKDKFKSKKSFDK